MIRFAVPPIGGENWFGGWMYMRNFVRALALYGDPEIETLLFVGRHRSYDPFIEELKSLPRTRIVVESAFEEGWMHRGTLTALATGRRAFLLDAFARQGVSVALDWATFYGWRTEIPVISWIPDFQHRLLPGMFGLGAWWKREIGFRAQTAVSQKILLSSATAERDCLRFYPSTRGRTHVARFAVPLDDWPDAPTALKALHDAGIHRDFVFLPNQLWHHKNHLVAIEAAGILAKRGSKRQIIATGRGGDPRRPGYRQELISRIEQSGAKGHFLLLEGVDHEQVKAMMIGANALLNPSRFEGWSTTVEEAKAIGTPLLLSDLDVHREQASAALFFEPDDALSLADAIETLPIRTPEVIASSIAAAREQNRLREIEFAQSISKLVKQVAENDRGHRAR